MNNRKLKAQAEQKLKTEATVLASVLQATRKLKTKAAATNKQANSLDAGHSHEPSRDPLPGELIRHGRLEHGPRAFFVEMSAKYGLLCDPDQPIEHGSRALMTLKDGSRFDCTVVTKHPAKAKTVRVQLLDGGTVLRGVDKKYLARVMSISSRI